MLYFGSMPKKKSSKKSKKASRKVPPWGRSEQHVQADLGLHSYSGDVPLGNNNPTVVQGVMFGGMPNRSRKAAGGLREWRGKRG